MVLLLTPVGCVVGATPKSVDVLIGGGYCDKSRTHTNYTYSTSGQSCHSPLLRVSAECGHPSLQLEQALPYHCYTGLRFYSLVGPIDKTCPNACRQSLTHIDQGELRHRLYAQPKKEQT